LIALSAALCTLNERPYDGEMLVKYGADLEAQTIRIPTGKQDYYAAVHGGVNAIGFRIEGNEVERLLPEEAQIKALEERLVLSFTGESRFSGTSNWNMMKRYIENEGATVRSMRNIKKTAIEMREALKQFDLPRFAALLDEEWENRKRLADGVSTERIERIMSAAKGAGAVASKICGAGGGGCMVTYVEPERRAAVQQAMSAAGAQILPFLIERKGLTVRRL